MNACPAIFNNHINKKKCNDLNLKKNCNFISCSYGCETWSLALKEEQIEGAEENIWT
jgi:hypothetical protein